jgi:hypothetical protein
VTLRKRQKNQSFSPELPGFAAVGISAFLCYDFFTKQAWKPDIGLEHSIWAEFFCDNQSSTRLNRGGSGRGVFVAEGATFWGMMNDQVEEA